MVRIDRFLSVCKVYKKRSLAKQALDDGLVMVNGKIAKPSTMIKNNDEITLYLGINKITIKADIKKDEQKIFVGYTLLYRSQERVPLC